MDRASKIVVAATLIALVGVIVAYMLPTTKDRPDLVIPPAATKAR